MMRTNELRRGLALMTALLVAGCQGGAGVGVKADPKGKGATPIARGGASLIGQGGATLIGLDGSSLIGLDGASLIGQDAAGIIAGGGGNLIGQGGSTLIGQDGAGISGTVNAPASLIGQDGAGIVAGVNGLIGRESGGNIVAGGGGNLIGQGGSTYEVLALAQRPLAKVRVYLQTADGKYVTGRDGKLLEAQSDAAGNFTFPGLRAGRNLVAVAALRAPGGRLHALKAIVSRDKDAGATHVDLASTVTTTYIVEKFVGSQDDRSLALDRLPALLDAQTRQAAAAALDRAVPAGLSQPDGSAVVAAAEELRLANPELAKQFEEVRRVIVLAGAARTEVANARGVTLGGATGVTDDGHGNLYVVERFTGILRRVAADGTSQILIGPGGPAAYEDLYLSFSAVKVGPDGWIYVAASVEGLIVKIPAAGGDPVTVAGGGVSIVKGEADPLQARLVSPRDIEFGPDGALWIAEGSIDDKKPGQLLRLDPGSGGRLRAVEVPLASNQYLAKTKPPYQQILQAVAVAPDGSVFVLERGKGELVRRGPDGTWQSWGPLRLDIGADSDLAALPDGSVLISLVLHPEGLPTLPVVQRFADEGATRRTLVGVDARGNDGDGGPATAAKVTAPTGVHVAADGTIYLADRDNGVVRAIAPDGVIRTVAGHTSTGIEDAQNVTLNFPGGLASDGAGGMFVSEFGSHVIKRVRDGRIEPFAGTTAGSEGDGGPATAAKFNGPGGLAYDSNPAHPALYVADTSNFCIRRIGADGVITRVVGQPGASEGLPVISRRPVADYRMGFVAGGIAVSPAGQLYWADGNHIYRLSADGQFVEFVAGNNTDDKLGDGGDGGPATLALLNHPFGLAFDRTGNLYVADTGNVKVRCIDPAGMIRTVAGAGIAQTLVHLQEGTAASERDVPALEANLLFPVSVTCHADGSIYIAEVGTRGGSGLPGLSFLKLPNLSGRIRRLTPEGRVVTLAGQGVPRGDVRVATPSGIAIDEAGRLVFVDSSTNQIKVLATR